MSRVFLAFERMLPPTPPPLAHEHTQVLWRTFLWCRFLPCCSIKYPDRKQRRGEREALFWLMAPEGRSLSWWQGREAVIVSWLIPFHTHTGSRGRTGNKNLKARPLVAHSLQQGAIALTAITTSITFPNTVTSWGPNFQKHEPMGGKGISHSNANACLNQLYQFLFLFPVQFVT